MAALNFSFAWGAGSMVSTAADVAGFYRALLGGKLLRPQQLKQMETIVTGSGAKYGLGLWERPQICGDSWGHPGDAVGYRSFAWSSKNGKHQAVVLITKTVDPISADVDLALGTLVDDAFCGS